jgi:hypothetical protein
MYGNAAMTLRKLLRGSACVAGELLSLPLLVVGGILATIAAGLAYEIGIRVLAAALIGLPAFYVLFGALWSFNAVCRRLAPRIAMSADTVEGAAAVSAGVIAIGAILVLLVRQLLL